MLFKVFRFLSVLAAIFVAQHVNAWAQRNFETVQIESIQVKEQLFMLVGEGGNLAVSVGKDGVFIVDDQFAPLTEKITNAIAKLSREPIRFVLNTHWHPDHTGGNENLGKAGVLIVAHDNVRVRMSVEQFMKAFNRRVPPAPEAALPVVTFNDSVSFHLNGDEIHAFHVPPAHTDGDSVVHFRRNNVIHMGDLFNLGGYPFIDLSSGGSIDGLIGACDRVLSMINWDTKVIPGHGPLGDYRALQQYRDMLSTVRSRVQTGIREEKTLETILSENPTREFERRWGQRSRSGEDFTKTIYRSLQGQQN